MIVPYKFPLVMGNEFVGVIEKLGAGVKRFSIGDRVYGRMPLNKIGAFAEYAAVDQKAIAKVPEYLSDEEAACVPLTALTALQALELMKPEAGEKIFISGGTGSLGAMAIPIAKSYGLTVELRDKYRMGEYEDKTLSIYSPLSVVETLSTGIIQNYWNKTENYETLAEYIRMNYDGLKDSVALLMDGGRLKVNINKYQNDMTSFGDSNDVLVMLIHLGYLGYDMDTKEVFIPNKEILDEFKTSTESEEWIDTFTSFKKSQKLLNVTWEGNEEKVAELLEWFHDTAENKTYNSEAALSYAVQMAYYAGQKYYTTIQELDSGKGYVDLVYLPSPKHPDKPALLQAGRQAGRQAGLILPFFAYLLDIYTQYGMG